ncbi:proteoglycan 4a isoform X3 [Oryzias melastigma]|uniref:proteoglycan 4a isoform X3 n=1 Tax=Oryzias melastigma TaxID=30732 RepID=UPI000CF837FE|nr:proteoglycan 4a isoform X3 [Oryzias melastigma]
MSATTPLPEDSLDGIKHTKVTRHAAYERTLQHRLLERSRVTDDSLGQTQTLKVVSGTMTMKMMLKLGFLPLILVLTSDAAAPEFLFKAKEERWRDEKSACGSGASGSCVGRCGEAFTRGQPCTCDFSCMQHNECCPDFEASCTAVRSCQGRCDELFRRGRPCDCDRQCVLFNTCCHDYQPQCGSHHRRHQPVVIKTSRNRKTEMSQETSNSESEESHSVQGRCPQCRGAQRQSSFGLFKPRVVGSSGPASPSSPANHLQHGGGNVPAALLPSPSSPQGTLPHVPAPGPSQPNLSASASGSSTPQKPSGSGGGKLKVQMLLYPGGFHPSGSGQVSGSAGSRPSSLQDMLQTLGLSVVQEAPEASGGDLSSGVDLCGDAFINGLTALNNGTILVFKGDLLWSVEPLSHSVGTPQRITETLGIPSPIDTAFTRTDCNRNTYIIKGDQYWQFDGNMVMKPGFPKPLTSEFPGLTGSISAALAVPATSSSPETVFFFKEGDIMLRFTFPPCSTPSLREEPRNSLKKNFAGRTAGALLSGEFNIRVSLKAFPTPVTAALSMHTPQGSDRYQHFIFSGPLFFKVHITDQLPWRPTLPARQVRASTLHIQSTPSDSGCTVPRRWNNFSSFFLPNT